MVKVFKWGLLGPAGLIVAAAVLAGVVYHEVSSKDTNALKTWIGGQVRDILQTYLTPQIEFQDLEYIYGSSGSCVGTLSPWGSAPGPGV